MPASVPESATAPSPVTARDAPRRLAEVQAVLCDMDGTLYVSDQLIPGADRFVSRLRQRGTPLLFLTNNSSARAVKYRDRLRRLGIPAQNDEILTSGAASADYLRDQTPHRRVFLLGTPELREELEEAGLTVLDARDPGDPDCVLVGFDKTLTYARLERACLLVAAGCPYYATHPDFTCITDRGLIPDTGAILAAIESVTHRTPKVLGKPMPEMVAAGLARLGPGARPETTAIIGDQLDTDMTMAACAGLLGVLVLSGETSRARLEAQDAVTPDLVVGSVAELLPWLGE